MSKKYCIFITALFCAFIGVFLVANAVSPDRTFSEMENRNLEQLPTPSVKTLLSGQFMKDFETYTTDQFVARDSWIGLKSATERVLGKQENNSVYFCDKDTLITRFDQPDSQKVTDNLTYVNNFVENVDIPVTFSLIPTQACIWADRLPAGAPNASQTDILAQAQAAVPGAAWADLYTTLWEHRDEDIFYRTDHHWTSLGAYYGYVGLAQALGYEPVSLDSYTETIRSTEFYGTVFSSSGVRWVKPDTISTYVPDTGISVVSHTYDSKGNPVEEPRALYDTSFLSVKDKYSMFLGGNQSLGVVTTPNTDKPKLLIIRDSYTDSLVPFLTPHFSEIHLIDLRYYKLSIQDYIEQNGIDQALVLYSVPNFVTDSNLLWIDR
ncbi:DHHW family protein [Intestinimonas massiliensis (ex Afouda et al. 2020)]|uniref:DHHW family protein n=1 Tax=Intestinimonas massiliensis (ex Afouda et al. 2020) TaxID=1673721 RepID=UPI0010304348|nr:DHHW family protein [Intestinimonas massiliensis (ex Afouda et al. 2020)]